MRYLFLLPLLWNLPTQANNESQCQQEFVDWMLHQQQQFSDLTSDKMTRLRAQRAIELARQEHEKAGGFCQTMLQIEEYLDNDPLLTPRERELLNVHPAS